MLSEKITGLQKLISDQKADYLVLASIGAEINDAVLTYVLTTEPEYAALLVPRLGQAILYTTPFEVPETQRSFPELLVKPFIAPLPQLIAEQVSNPAQLLFREANFPYQLHKLLTDQGHTLVPAQNLHQVIARKNAAEIAAMRTVATKTDELYSALLAHWSEFVTEADAARFISEFALHNDCTISFPPIVASGAHAAEPHHRSENLPLVPGFCVLDFGLKIDGYCSDVTRTIYLGEPNAAEKEYYALVHEAQHQAELAIKPGIKASELDVIARKVLGESEKNFIHGLGHGLGTAVHEWPNISGPSQAVLEAGMTITIEPGIYVPGQFGIRLEDDVLVTDTGYEILTHATKELVTMPVISAGA